MYTCPKRWEPHPSSALQWGVTLEGHSGPLFFLAHWAGRWSKQRDGEGEDIGSELELGLFVLCSSDTVGMGIPVFPPNP